MSWNKRASTQQAKAFKLAALEGGRRVPGEEHNDTLASLNNMGWLLQLMKDWKGALDYYQQALSAYERVLGKKNPDTLTP